MKTRGEFAALLALTVICQASPGEARPTYPDQLDRQCTLAGRTPPNPAALARASAPLGDCALCHSGSSPSGGNATADGFAFLSGNLDPFCLLAMPNRAPVLDPIGSRQVDVGVALSIALHATDPDADALAFSATPLPAGAILTDAGNGTATFAWTPTAAQAGSHSVSFSVSDGALADGETISIGVGPVDAPPLLDPIGDQVVDLGAQLALSFAASDPEGGPLTFSAVGVPATATFVDNGDGTASLSWLADALGSHPVTVTVEDSATPPGSASESFSISVRDPNATGPALLQARWSARGQKLGVRGSGAAPRGPVEIVDAASGASLGARRANDAGGFGGWLRPFLAPCEVQARADGALGPALAVADAPADCGQHAFTRVRRAEWSCDGNELRVEGDRGPVGGSVRVLDPDQGGLVLGEATPDRKGRFRVELALASGPARIQLAVLAGTGEWTLEPTPVTSRGECASDGSDDGSDGGVDDRGLPGSSTGGGDHVSSGSGSADGGPSPGSGISDDDHEDRPTAGAGGDHDGDDEHEQDD